MYKLFNNDQSVNHTHYQVHIRHLSYAKFFHTLIAAGLIALNKSLCTSWFDKLRNFICQHHINCTYSPDIVPTYMFIYETKISYNDVCLHNEILSKMEVTGLSGALTKASV